MIYHGAEKSRSPSGGGADNEKKEKGKKIKGGTHAKRGELGHKHGLGNLPARTCRQTTKEEGGTNKGKYYSLGRGIHTKNAPESRKGTPTQKSKDRKKEVLGGIGETTRQCGR